MTAPECAAFREVAPEVALGIADGDRRSVALEHLAGCAACRQHLDGLTATLDSLLLVSPEVDPPEGFSDRVLATFDPVDEPVAEPIPTAGPSPIVAPAPIGSGSGGRPRRVWAVAAAAVLILGLAAAGFGSARSTGGAAPRDAAAGAGHEAVLARALKTAGGDTVGRVSLHHESDDAGSRYHEGAEIHVSLGARAPVGTYRVQCDYAEGRPYTAGLLRSAAGGASEWSARVTVPTDDLRRVRLISTTGGPNLEAEFGS